MTFLYRTALVVTRRQPYTDWAKSQGDGAELAEYLDQDRRTVYLGPEMHATPSLSSLVEDYWRHIFDLELAAWSDDPDSWPNPRGRELFQEWFDVELISSVVDLVPDEPLTQQEIDAGDIDYAFHHCAWCDVGLERGAGRMVGFALDVPASPDFTEAQVLPVPGGDGGALFGIMTARDSDAAADGHDLVFRACSSRCEKLIRKEVPRGLRKLERMARRPTGHGPK